MKLYIEERVFSIMLKVGKPFLSNEKGYPRRELELPRETFVSLRHFLVQFSQKYKYAGRFPINVLDTGQDEINPDFGVSVNSVENELLPDRLDTELREADELEITMVMLGGG
ncbi:MAG: hypothetical protein Q8P44_00010 [Dehalococcoidia bacterium]|nr:hypothetical protein [Dehalococcoidia bacterium]